MSSAWPDPWRSASPAVPPNPHGVLLRLQAEMFVAARVRDQETIRTFEAMALGLLPRADCATLAAVTELVAPCADTPEAVLAGLALHEAQARRIIAASAPRLPAAVIDLLLGAPAERSWLAGRPDLDDATLARLLVLDDGTVDATLAANPALSPGHPAFAALLDRARERRALADVLLARGDLSLPDETALYLHADPARRAAIRSRIPGSALFQRPHLPARLGPSDIAALLAEAERGDVQGLEERLSDALALPPGTPWRLLEAGRHELLALALTGLGVHEEDALRIFLTLHPAISHSVATVFALARVTKETLRATALALVEAILGRRAGAHPTGRLVPERDERETPARAKALAADRSRPVLEERRPSTGRGA